MPETQQRPRPTGWIIAVLLVVGVWAGAYALRTSGEKQVLAGWQDGMAAGQLAAAESDRPMLVLFTSERCGPCKALKKNVLTEPAVHDALQAGFVPVQIDLTDPSSDNPNHETAGQYGIRSIPTIIAMTPGGERIETYQGQRTAEGLTAWLTRLAE